MTITRKYAVIAGFITPFIAFMVLFQYAPIVIMFRDSLYKYNLMNPAAKEYVGLSNFQSGASNQQLQKAIIVTLLFAVGLVALEIPLGLALALFVNQSFPGVRILRTAAFTPVVTSVVVVATLWTFMLDPSHGLINTLLQTLNIGPQPFLTSSYQALPAIIVMTAWEQIGLSMILFLSGLQSIPRDLLEAAAIDGAGRWRRLRFVTIPLLKRTTLFIVVIMTVFAFQAFAPAFVMTHGGPQNSTLLLVYYIYLNAFTLLRAGYASAIAVILMAIIFVVGVVQMALLRTKWIY